MTHFISYESYEIKLLAGKLKDSATRCVLRPVDASKCICRPRWGSLQRSPDLLAGFGEGNKEGRMEKLGARDGKGTKAERKEREGKEKGRQNTQFSANKSPYLRNGAR